jgi:hypothetical protein
MPTPVLALEITLWSMGWMNTTRDVPCTLRLERAGPLRFLALRIRGSQ